MAVWAKDGDRYGNIRYYVQTDSGWMQTNDQGEVRKREGQAFYILLDESENDLSRGLSKVTCGFSAGFQYIGADLPSIDIYLNANNPTLNQPMLHLNTGTIASSWVEQNSEIPLENPGKEFTINKFAAKDGDPGAADEERGILPEAKFIIKYRANEGDPGKWLYATGEYDEASGRYKITESEYKDTKPVDDEYKITDESGIFSTKSGKPIIISGDLKDGIYDIREVVAPEGFELSTNGNEGTCVQTIVLPFSDGETGVRNFINQSSLESKLTLKIYKYQEPVTIGQGEITEGETVNNLASVLLPGAKYLVWYYPRYQDGQALSANDERFFKTKNIDLSTLSQYEGVVVSRGEDGNAVYNMDKKVEGYRMDGGFEQDESWQKRSFIPQNIEDLPLVDSGSSGCVDLNNIYPGTYLVKEVEAPDRVNQRNRRTRNKR